MNIFKLFPFIKVEIHNKELCFVVKTNLVDKALFMMKNQFKMLTYISGIYYPNNSYRFQVVYELLSLKFNSRTRIKCYENELIPVASVEKIFIGASWWECEVWDMFSVFFNNYSNLVRILTDYGFDRYPLRKDFPLSGFMNQDIIMQNSFHIYSH